MIYLVQMRVTVLREFEVEADSEAEARTKAERYDVLDESHDMDTIDWDVVSVDPSE